MDDAAKRIPRKWSSPKGKRKGMTVKGKSKAICDVRGNLIPKFIPWNMVKMRRPKTSQLCDSRDTRGTLQHELSMSGVSNICGPFSEATRKVKFLIVAIDYFIKWIEAKTVAAITGKQVMKFVWDNIVCSFGLSREIISDNEKQFRDNLFRTWCEKLNITQHFASVKHSQSNTVWSTLLKPRYLVYYSNEAIKKEDTRKLGPKWEGPYEVIETLGDEAYRLRD
ncbi:reverse transcriptase domain-containing protein [Tanacetum coccineum]